jgi:hypothetical protein
MIGSARAFAIGTDHDQRLVDAPVIAVIVEEDLRPPRDGAGKPDRPAVRVSRREGEAPVREPESARELGPNPLGILRRHHRRRAAKLGVAHVDRPDGGFRRMPRHGARVAEAEIREVVAVDVLDVRAFGFREVEREPARALVHPGHGDPTEQVPRRVISGQRARVALPIGPVRGDRTHLLKEMHPFLDRYIDKEWDRARAAPREPGGEPARTPGAVVSQTKPARGNLVAGGGGPGRI